MLESFLLFFIPFVLFYSAGCGFTLGLFSRYDALHDAPVEVILVWPLMLPLFLGYKLATFGKKETKQIEEKDIKLLQIEHELAGEIEQAYQEKFGSTTRVGGSEGSPLKPLDEAVREKEYEKKLQQTQKLVDWFADQRLR